MASANKDRPLFQVTVDIPSSYRVHEFRVLSEVLAERRIAFHAVFMSRGQKGRQWRYETEHFGFAHSFAAGPTFYPAEDLPVHLTPGAWFGTLRRAPTWLLLGGSWYQPPIIASAAVSRARHRLMWAESWESRRGERGSRIRAYVLGRCQGFVVPGERAEASVRDQTARPILNFGNTVDETVFRDRVAELRAGRDRIRASFGFGEEVVFAWPARLNPVKGIEPFLNAIRGVSGDYTIAIAGDGPERQKIEALTSTLPHVRLLGHLWPDDLMRLYSVADALLLPSLFEPFGFVAVEALWAGLPLLLSDRVGAGPEVLIPGENGWSVDTEDGASVRETFAAMVSAGSAGLGAMGGRSLAIAEERFASRPSAERFVDELLLHFPYARAAT